MSETEVIATGKDDILQSSVDTGDSVVWVRWFKYADGKPSRIFAAIGSNEWVELPRK